MPNRTLPVPGPCACGCANVRHTLHSLVTNEQGHHDATELRWCPRCGRVTATSSRPEETYRGLRDRADHEWNVAQVAASRADALSHRLGILDATERRVLAAICHLGAGQAQPPAIAGTAGLAAPAVTAALDRLHQAGLITRTLTHHLGLPIAGWWPASPLHGLLALALEIVELHA